jgi:hypothetical protein
MFRLIQYYNRYQGVRGRLDGMPAWARVIVGICAIPGILLIGLSIVAFCVSLLALLLLTVPVYQLLKVLTGAESLASTEDGSQGIAVDVNTTVLDPSGDPPAQPRRQVEVKIVE